MTFQSNSPAAENRIELRFIALYENHQIARRAQTGIINIAAQLRGEFSITGKQWSVQVLDYPALRTHATDEVNKADIVFLAIESTTGKAREMLQWIQEWKRKDGERPAAIVLLLQVSQNAAIGGQQHLVDAFELMAEEKGMSFFSSETSFVDALLDSNAVTRLDQDFHGPTSFDFLHTAPSTPVAA